MSSSSYVHVSRGSRTAPNDYELQRFAKHVQKPSTASTDYDHGEVLDDFDYDDPLGRRPRSDSDASLETFQLFTPDEEARVRRKLDRRVVTIVAGLYLLSFLDRSNIGNAKIAGMMRDLRLDDAQFEWLLTAFYVTYIAFEWMILLYHTLSPKVYISLCVFSWGIIASLQAVATSFPAMLVLRLLLGVSEAAFGPGVPFYLSFFYKRDELALRTGFQLAAAPLASSFAGSLAYLITWLGQDGALAPWRLLFLVEGFPSVIVAIVTYHLIPDNPQTAAFLTPRERHVATVRLRAERGHHAKPAPRVRVAGQPLIAWREVWETLRDPKCYLTALMFLNCNIAFSSMPVFLPTVIHEMGFSALSSQALSAPPYLFAFVVLLLTARASDRLRARSPFVLMHSLAAFAGYALVGLGGYYRWPDWIRYVCIYPACAGFFSAVTIIITWTINNQESSARKGTGMAILNIIGQCGPLIGTRLYPDAERPYFVRGMGVCAIAMLIVFFLTLMLRFVLVWENRRRAARDAKQSELDVDDDYGSRDRQGRFVLML